MFSGIVETIGKVKSLHTSDVREFIFSHNEIFSDLKIGDSVAVNGVCLTVTHFTESDFAVTAVPETLRLTNLGLLAVDSVVNLERSLSYNGRIGGHCVQGHVDGVGEILEINKDGNEALIVKISVPAALMKYIVNKGYVTLDGMSITVITATENHLTVTFIPHTQQVTIVQQYKVGSKVNIEVDILGKYVEKLLEAHR